MNATLLLLCLTAVGFQATPPPPPPPIVAAEPPVILEVRGSKEEARKILRSQGIEAVELRGSAYVLPAVEIMAPTEVGAGEMVVISAKIDKTKFPDGLVQVKYQWAVFRDGLPMDNVVVWPDGTQIFFAAGLKKSAYNVCLDVDCLFGDQKTVDGKPALVNPEIDSPDIAVKTIQVAGGSVPTPEPPAPIPTPTPEPDPKPPTPPTPTPDPDPTFEQGKYGISKLLYDHMKAYPGLTVAEKYALGQSLGTAFQTLAGQIAGLEQMRNVPAILAAAKELNNAAVVRSGVDPAKVATLKQQMGDYLNQLYSEGKCVTPDDFRAAAAEVGAGLKAIGKP